MGSTSKTLRTVSYSKNTAEFLEKVKNPDLPCDKPISIKSLQRPKIAPRPQSKGCYKAPRWLVRHGRHDFINSNIDEYIDQKTASQSVRSSPTPRNSLYLLNCVLLLAEKRARLV